VWQCIIPTATLRPETIHASHLWANPGITYVRARVDDSIWIISKEAAEKLALQDHTVEIENEIAGQDLIDELSAIRFAVRSLSSRLILLILTSEAGSS